MQSQLFKRRCVDVAREMKCFYCKTKYEKDLMHCDESKKNEKVLKKYFHFDCFDKYKEEQEFKKREFTQWDCLYQYILKIHNVDLLDSRMIGKIQDLRNGSIKLNGEKIKRYKDGIGYDVIMETYKQQSNNIEWVIKNKNFDKKYNEFSYVFSIILNNVNDINESLKTKKKQEDQNIHKVNKTIGEYEDIKINLPKLKKKDEMDISDFL
jgi:hypothetical protein